MEKHYDNSKGSLYKFAEDQNLNAWEFDLVKRIVRSRKKGNFKQDLEKTKFLIDLYLEEYEDETKEIDSNKTYLENFFKKLEDKNQEYYYLVDGDVIENGDQYFDVGEGEWIVREHLVGKIYYNSHGCYKTRRKIV